MAGNYKQALKASKSTPQKSKGSPTKVDLLSPVAVAASQIEKIAEECVSSLTVPVSPDSGLSLESVWTFWYDKYPGPNLSPAEYKAALVEIGSVHSIPIFWQWYNNLKGPDQLGPRQSFHLMKSGIYPLWEDEANIHGGKLTIKIDRSATGRAWLGVLLGLIGEQFWSNIAPGDDICGATVSVRRNETCLSLWNMQSEKINVEKIESTLHRLLPGITFREVVYKAHKSEESFHTAAAEAAK